MDKVERLLKEAQKRIPPVPPIDYSYATTEELHELINKATTHEQFQEIVYVIADRAGKGQLWDRSG